MRYRKTQQGYLELEISTKANWRKFNQIAKSICTEFHGSIIEKLDGIDERYWDIKISDVVVTLHLQHYFGIMVYANDDNGDKTIREIGFYLENSGLINC